MLIVFVSSCIFSIVFLKFSCKDEIISLNEINEFQARKTWNEDILPSISSLIVYMDEEIAVAEEGIDHIGNMLLVYYGLMILTTVATVLVIFLNIYKTYKYVDEEG